MKLIDVLRGDDKAARNQLIDGEVRQVLQHHVEALTQIMQAPRLWIEKKTGSFELKKTRSFSLGLMR